MSLVLNPDKFFHGWCSVLLEVTVIIYTLNKAARKSFLGTAVVIQIFSPVSAAVVPTE